MSWPLRALESEKEKNLVIMPTITLNYQMEIKKKKIQLNTTKKPSNVSNPHLAPLDLSGTYAKESFRNPQLL